MQPVITSDAAILPVFARDVGGKLGVAILGISATLIILTVGRRGEKAIEN